MTVRAGGVTNSYLLPCTGGYLLIDTGYDKDYDAFILESGTKGVGIADIRFLLLTHHHDDHSGFAARLLRESGATLIVHEKAFPFLSEGKPEMRMKPLNRCTLAAFTVFAALFKNDKTHGFPPVEANTRMRIIRGDDAEFLKGIGVEGMILSTPGHTDDSISVLLANGNAFVGDLAMDMLGICGCAHRPIYANDYGQVYQGWKRLSGRGAKKIFPSHGDPFDAASLLETMKEKPLDSEAPGGF
ncbi:MAG: MBL fold metallo-hydrolase [Spirochaetes bacterium]|nr:MAG: MBL fold metallo-hydrolase [Spirochaetota bacterium]